jgi:hypothetical protein
LAIKMRKQLLNTSNIMSLKTKSPVKERKQWKLTISSKSYATYHTVLVNNNTFVLYVVLVYKWTPLCTVSLYISALLTEKKTDVSRFCLLCGVPRVRHYTAHEIIYFFAKSQLVLINDSWNVDSTKIKIIIKKNKHMNLAKEMLDKREKKK